MSAGSTVTIAAVQATPVFLDRDATVERLVGHIEDAARQGAQLVVFPEAVVPGYPDWVWRRPAWADGDWYRRLHDQSVDIPGPVTDRLGKTARDAGVWLAARGNSCIVGPHGTLLAGPLVGEAGMLVMTVDLSELTLARRQFDPVGHYARPDRLELVVHDPPPTPAQRQS